ncbi:MAG: tripartite tricarboxylate transporter permease, partial [Pyramidobacter sp.]|nr:tripartite tricarboxylate transporter permease [Pyramidobacter sp.]
GVPAGGLIPLLALGIPGSNSTAILMVGFSLAGISCGPMLFLTQPQIPYGLMASMFMAQIVLIFVGLLMLRPCVYITSIKKIYLTSAIMMFAFIGAFSTTNDVYSIILVMVFGLIGFAMKELGFAPAATVLGFVLGELVEGNLRRTLQMSRGSMDIFFAGGLNKFFIALTILGVLFPYISKWLAARRKAKAAA